MVAPLSGFKLRKDSSALEDKAAISDGIGSGWDKPKTDYSKPYQKTYKADFELRRKYEEELLEIINKILRLPTKLG
jgi:hypothetical protein